MTKMEKIELDEVEVLMPGAQYPVRASMIIESDGDMNIDLRHPEAATMIWQLIKSDRFLGLEINLKVRQVEAQQTYEEAREGVADDVDRTETP